MEEGDAGLLLGLETEFYRFAEEGDGASGFGHEPVNRKNEQRFLARRDVLK